MSRNFGVRDKREFIPAYGAPPYPERDPSDRRGWPPTFIGPLYPGGAKERERKQSALYCSLIPGLGVKLSNDILAGPTVLSAGGVSPPEWR